MAVLTNLTTDEVSVINNSSPAAQNVQLGTKVYDALNALNSILTTSDSVKLPDGESMRSGKKGSQS